MKHGTIHVALLGIEARSRKLLGRLLEKSEMPPCTLTEPDHADVLIVDNEGELEERQLLALYQQPPAPLIVLSEKAVRAPNITWVSKPIQSRILFQAIWKLGRDRDQVSTRKRQHDILALSSRVRRETRVHLRQAPRLNTASLLASSNRSRQDDDHFYCGAIDDLQFMQRRLPEALFYDPKTCLQGYIQATIDESQRRDRAVVVRGLGRDIIVFHRGQFVASGLSDFQLRQACMSQIDSKRLVFLLLREATLDERRLKEKAIRADAFLWKVALWSAQGRLPSGTDIDRPVSLAAWPNLTRLALFPHALQLAALWYRQAISIRAAAALLNIPHRYVVSFYAAALQQGLIRHHARPEIFIEPERGADKGLMRRVLGYLKQKVIGQ